MKLNNKGFAISTMLYGLLIIATILVFTLLSIVAFTKKSSNDFVYDVEQELNAFGDSHRGYCSK